MCVHLCFLASLRILLHDLGDKAVLSNGGVTPPISPIPSPLHTSAHTSVPRAIVALAPLVSAPFLLLLLHTLHICHGWITVPARLVHVVPLDCIPDPHPIPLPLHWLKVDLDDKTSQDDFVLTPPLHRHFSSLSLHALSSQHFSSSLWTTKGLGE
jgi:hypothetical protein